jgi:hypothetical protein
VEQTLKETTPGRPPICYALLSLFDEHAQREAVQLLRDAVETGAVRALPRQAFSLPSCAIRKSPVS